MSDRRFYLVVVASGIAFGMTAPLTSLFAKGLGASDLAAGVAVGSISVTLIAVDVFGTRCIPRIDARYAIWTALAVFGTFSLVSAVAPDYATMVGARVCQGAGAALMMGGSLQLAVRGVPPGEGGRALGSFNAAFFAGIAVGPLFGGAVSEVAGGGQTGIRAAFAACGVISLAAALLARFVLPALPGELPPEVGWPRLPGRQPKLSGSLLLGMFGQALRAGVAFTILPLFAAERLGLSTFGVVAALTALSVTDVTSMCTLGGLADRLGRRPVLVVAIGVGALGAAFTARTGGLGPFVVCCALLGLAVGATTVVPAAMVIDCSVDRADALSAYRIASDLGAVVGAVGASAIVGSRGMNAGLLSTTAALALAALGTVWLGETGRVHAPHTNV